jgi:hypothetical protein
MQLQVNGNIAKCDKTKMQTAKKLLLNYSPFGFLTLSDRYSSPAL